MIFYWTRENRRRSYHLFYWSICKPLYKMASKGRDLRRFVEFGRKIIGVGRNYRFVLAKRFKDQTTHLFKAYFVSVLFLRFTLLSRPNGSPQQPPPSEDPLIFLKPSSTYLKPGGKIRVSQRA